MKKLLSILVSMILVLGLVSGAIAEEEIIIPVDAVVVPVVETVAETPVVEANEETAPAAEEVVEEVPAEETPAAEEVMEEIPTEEIPTEEVVEEIPTEEIPAEEVVEEVPAESTPVESAPVESTPVESVPVETTPEEATSSEATAGEATSSEATAGEATEGEAMEDLEIPKDATKVYTLQDALNPDRSIDIWASFEGDTLCAGTRVTLYAVLNGYDNLTYNVWWEMNDGSGWKAVGAKNSLHYSFVLNEYLYNASWRVVVDITAGEIDIPEAEAEGETAVETVAETEAVAVETAEPAKVKTESEAA